MGKAHVPMPKLTAETKPIRPLTAGIRRAELGCREIQFRFVLIAKVNATEELWTSRALPVDGLRGRLRQFRKSHHLIRAGCGNPVGLQLAATHQMRVGLPRV